MIDDRLNAWRGWIGNGRRLVPAVIILGVLIEEMYPASVHALIALSQLFLSLKMNPFNVSLHEAGWLCHDATDNTLPRADSQGVRHI
jgi:hypothetical protein